MDNKIVQISKKLIGDRKSYYNDSWDQKNWWLEDFQYCVT